MCECQGNPLARVTLALGLPYLLVNRPLAWSQLFSLFMGYDALYTTKNILAPFQYKYFAYQEKSAAHVNSVVFLLLFSQLLRAKVSPLHLYFQVLTRSKNAWTSLDKFLWTPWCSVCKQITITYMYVYLAPSIYPEGLSWVKFCLRLEKFLTQQNLCAIF